jgi:hypothetical protein
MSDVSQFLSSMNEKGIRLWIEDGQLRYRVARGALNPGEIKTLKALKGEILAELTQRQMPSMHQPRLRSQAPLTFQQEAYWNFFCSKDPTWNHFSSFVLSLHGALNVDALRTAVRSVTARHESLRTKIVRVEGALTQDINERAEDRLNVVTFPKGPDDDIRQQGRLFLKELLNRRLDPAIGPLFQVHLLKFTDHEHVLSVAIHHVLTDAMSMALLFRELWSLYDNLVQGHASSLSEVPMRYSDYAYWQRGTRQQWLEAHDSYWKTRLLGASRLRLPSDGGLSSVRPFSPKVFRMSFGVPLSYALRELARSERTSLALVILAIYSAVSSSWCEQKDFVVPFNVTGRTHSEHVNVMGLFFHSLLLRIELTDCETFIDVLQAVSQEFFTAHQHLDFGTLLRDVPHLYEGTILQCLSWQPGEITSASTSPGEQDGKAGLVRESFPDETYVIPETFHLRTDLQIGIQEDPQGISAFSLYRADLFTASTIQAFFGNLRSFSEHIVKSPRGRVTSFPWHRPPIAK